MRNKALTVLTALYPPKLTMFDILRESMHANGEPKPVERTMVMVRIEYKPATFISSHSVTVLGSGIFVGGAAAYYADPGGSVRFEVKGESRWALV